LASQACEDRVLGKWARKLVVRELPWFPFYVPNYVFLTQDTRSSTYMYNKKKKKKKRRKKKKVLFYRWPVSHKLCGFQ